MKQWSRCPERPPAAPARVGRGTGTRLAALGAALLALAVRAPAAPQEDGVEVRTFSMPDTRAAAALAERVKQHVGARRWSECLGDLQELIEVHRDELLGEGRPLRSQQPVHAGVSVWARDALLSLPPEVREMYRERYGPRALAAFERARATADLSALVAIPRRWPLTRAAELSWWTVGDLELERGNRAEARLAWSRALAARLGRTSLDLGAGGSGWSALDEHEAAGGRFEEGVTRRLELARRFAEAAVVQDAPRRDELRLPGPGEGALGTPAEEASTWAQPYLLREHPWPLAPIAMHPVRAGDAVLVSNSMGLACVNAYSGTERWYSGEAPGWTRLEGKQRSEFFDGLDYDGALIAPAASDSIAVAALQIPVSQHENAHFNQIPILVIIPDRRLFAFDVETGRQLWNHLPPPGWDGEAGTFSERMRVAGPPVIQAGRVFVAAYRMQGRVDCHLACYELATGELIWSTQIVSGQRELNMFNRHQREYSAPPVRIEGDRVVVLTQLGTVASVDFFSGAVQWETIYDQNPLPPRTGHNGRPRDPSWRNAAPVVADGVVIATPVDSDDLIGIDLETGAMLWSMRQRQVSDLAAGRSTTDVNLLLGADEHRVYLAGRRMVALEAPAGLRYEPPVRVAWRLEDEFLRQEDSYARPVLAADRIVVPTRTQRIEIDRYQGIRLRHPVPWREGHGGNLLLGDGMLFTLDSRALCGYFEWSFLLSRARAAHEDDPDSPGPALELAGLLAERGRTEREAGRSDRARAMLDEAAGVLAPFLSEDGRDADPGVAARLFAILRSKARVMTDLADAGAALEALRSARAIAPNREASRDCLLEESELLRGRDEAERLRTLEELDFAAGDLLVRCENLAVGGVEASSSDAPIGRAQPPVYAGPGVPARRLAPLLDRPPRAELGVWELPVGLWVALERTDEAAARGDAARELAELHRVLELWADEPLPGGSAGRIASRRIGRLLERGARDAHAPFERRASELLDEALAADDARELERIVARYPHSTASRRANDLLLARAAEEGAISDAAAIVLGELPDPWRPRNASERELELVLRLGGALREAGNETYERELVRVLAAARPDAASPLPEHGGRTLRELALERTPPPTPVEPPPRGFDGSCIAVASFDGRHELLGAIPPAGPGGSAEVLLFAREENPERSHSTRRVSLVAFGAERPDEPLWTEELPDAQAPPFWTDRATFAPGLALVATRRDVIALARDGKGRSGRPRQWTWPASGGDLEAVVASSGMVLAVVDQPGGPYRLHALDAQTGSELWRTEVAGGEYGHAPICGSGKIVLLPRNVQQRALVHDLFTGRRTLEIELPVLRNEDARGAWIEDGRVVVPWFWQSRYATRNQVLALDLQDGEVAWRVSLSELEDGQLVLHSVLQAPGQTLLVLRRPLGYSSEGPAGRLFDLRTPFGAFAPIRELADEHKLVGVEAKSRVALDAPLFFLQSHANGDRELRIHAVQLPYGNERWVQRIAVPREELSDNVLPPPALGATTVGFVFSTNDPKWSHQTELHCFDRATGASRGSQVLDKRLGKSSEISLHPLGDALLLRGQDMLQVMR